MPALRPVDYLAGMKRGEAINYIQNLPGLTRREFTELMDVAEKRPERRTTYFDYEETIKLRVRSVVDFLRNKPNGASTQDVAHFLKMNGTNVSYALRKAVEWGGVFVVRVEKHGKKIFSVTAKGSKEVPQ